MSKFIHQIWFDMGNGSQVPSRYQPYIDSWRHHHPHWQYMLWNETKARTFLNDHYGWFLSLYDSYKSTIHRVDALRYFLLFHFGGAYVDIDTECERPLDVLLSRHPDKELFFFESSRGIVNNAVMLARNSGNRFFSDVCFPKLVRNHESWWHMNNSWFTVMWMSGPMFLQGCISKHLKQQQRQWMSSQTSQTNTPLSSRSVRQQTKYGKQDDKTSQFPCTLIVLPPTVFPSRAHSQQSKPDKRNSQSNKNLELGVHHFAKSWSNHKRLAADVARIAAVNLLLFLPLLLLLLHYLKKKP